MLNQEAPRRIAPTLSLSHDNPIEEMPPGKTRQGKA